MENDLGDPSLMLWPGSSNWTQPSSHAWPPTFLPSLQPLRLSLASCLTLSFLKTSPHCSVAQSGFQRPPDNDVCLPGSDHLAAPRHLTWGSTSRKDAACKHWLACLDTGASPKYQQLRRNSAQHAEWLACTPADSWLSGPALPQ